MTTIAPLQHDPCTEADAWRGLEELRPVLLKFLIRRCRDESEADDLIQETFIRAARYRRDLSSHARLRSWIVQIAANVFRDHVRRGQRGLMQSCEDEILDRIECPASAPPEGDHERVLELAGELIDTEVLLADLCRALAALRDRDRILLSAFYGDGRSTVEIGARSGLSPALVKVRLFRARRRLERTLRLGIALRRARRLATFTVGAS